MSTNVHKFSANQCSMQSIHQYLVVSEYLRNGSKIGKKEEEKRTTTCYHKIFVQSPSVISSLLKKIIMALLSGTSDTTHIRCKKTSSANEEDQKLLTFQVTCKQTLSSCHLTLPQYTKAPTDQTHTIFLIFKGTSSLGLPHSTVYINGSTCLCY